MSTPPTTTTIAVAVTMTLAAVRTEGGSRRNRDIRRSIGFGWRLSVPMARSSVDWLAIITDANGWEPQAAVELPRRRRGRETRVNHGCAARRAPRATGETDRARHMPAAQPPAQRRSRTHPLQAGSPEARRRATSQEVSLPHELAMSSARTRRSHRTDGAGWA